MFPKKINQILIEIVSKNSFIFLIPSKHLPQTQQIRSKAQTHKSFSSPSSPSLSNFTFVTFNFVAQTSKIEIFTANLHLRQTRTLHRSNPNLTSANRNGNPILTKSKLYSLRSQYHSLLSALVFNYSTHCFYDLHLTYFFFVFCFELLVCKDYAGKGFLLISMILNFVLKKSSFHP
jgi:hypothetical protein